MRRLALAYCCSVLALIASSLQGTVRDSQGHPVASAVVYVQAQGPAAGPGLTAHTDSEGRYRFPDLPEGAYAVRAEMEGYRTTPAGACVLAKGEAKNLDLVLDRPAASGQPEFFDEPQFTVAGVTDNMYRGGHGSGMGLINSEALVKATAALSKDSPADSSSSGQHHALAEAAEKRHDALVAAREYQLAARMQPSETNLFDWGTELLTHRAAQQAGEVFAQGVQRFPDSVRMLLGLAAAAYSQGSYEQAATRFFEACDRTPADPGPYLFLGKIQSLAITQQNGYIERLRRFASLQPGNAMANYYYAVSLWKSRQTPDEPKTAAHVQTLLEKAIHLDPTLAAAHLEQGIVHSDRKDYAAAIAAYRKAIEVNPRLEEAHYRLAQAYRRVGDKGKSQEELELYGELSKQSAQEMEQERAEIQQFVFTLKTP